MEYMILIYGDERGYGSATEAQLKAMYQEYRGCAERSKRWQGVPASLPVRSKQTL